MFVARFCVGLSKKFYFLLDLASGEQKIFVFCLTLRWGSNKFLFGGSFCVGRAKKFRFLLDFALGERKNFYFLFDFAICEMLKNLPEIASALSRTKQFSAGISCRSVALTFCV